ncbi:MAG: S6e family ribosomal protein [Nanoarchaeota archaeon]
MVDYKLVLNDTKNAKSYQREISGEKAQQLKGKKIRDIVKGDDIGFAGYEFQITGGSDRTGFPMRWDVDSATKKKILAVSGVGVKKGRKGMKVRKTVAGNTIGNETVQINMKVLKEGKEKLGGEESSQQGQGES